MGLIGSSVCFNRCYVIEDKSFVLLEDDFEGILIGPPDYETIDFLSVNVGGKIVLVDKEDIVLPIDEDRFKHYSLHYGD